MQLSRMIAVTTLNLALFAGAAAQTAEPPQSSLATPGTARADAVAPASECADILPAATAAANKANNNRELLEGAWTVLPYKVVRDNYGPGITGRYFVIDMALHNCSNKQLVVNALHFDHGKNHEVNTDPAMVRGTLQKAHDTGLRTTSINIIKTMGLLATGASGFVKATASAAAYNRGVTIFSDPFEKGIELIFPDTISNYLKNWDSTDVFKSGFVLAPGGQGRGRIFYPILSLYSPTTQARDAKDATKGRFNAQEVKTRLGTLRVFMTASENPSGSSKTLE